jgi:hypothetical protein
MGTKVEQEQANNRDGNRRLARRAMNDEMRAILAQCEAKNGCYPSELVANIMTGSEYHRRLALIDRMHRMGCWWAQIMGLAIRRASLFRVQKRRQH